MHYYIRKIYFVMLYYIFWVFNAFSRRTENTVIMFHTGKMGDLVCMTPVFRAVKDTDPNTKLVVIARHPFTAVLGNNPHIDELITFTNKELIRSWTWLLATALRLRKQKPKYYINLANDAEAHMFGMFTGAKERLGVTTSQDGKLQKITYLGFTQFEYKYDKQIKEHNFDMLRSVGMNIINPKNELFFTTPPEGVSQIFESLKSKTVIGVSVASGKGFKRWPTTEWIELLKELSKDANIHFMFFGSEKEIDEIRVVSQHVREVSSEAIGVPLGVVPYYLQKCDLFISVDTGPLYIADAFGVPVVDILGPCDDTTQRPENNYRIVVNREHCKPVSKILLTPGKKHYNEIEKCFNSITVGQVLVACKELLK